MGGGKLRDMHWTDHEKWGACLVYQPWGLLYRSWQLRHKTTLWTFHETHLLSIQKFTYVKKLHGGRRCWPHWPGFTGKSNDLPGLLTWGYSVQFSRSVTSNSLWPHGLQHTRPPCPLPTPRVHSNSCPLSQWYHPTISSSVVPFSSCLQSFPASGSFPMSWLFTSGGQSIGVSASALPMNIQGWFPVGLTDWISLQSKGLSSLLQHHSSKASILRHSSFFIVQLSHPYKTILNF